MTEKKQHQLIAGAAIVGGGVLLWMLWRAWMAYQASPSQVVANAPAPANAAASGTSSPFPGNTYNLSFQTPNLLTAPPLGVYVPLFGFIGIGPYAVQ